MEKFERLGGTSTPFVHPFLAKPPEDGNARTWQVGVGTLKSFIRLFHVGQVLSGVDRRRERGERTPGGKRDINIYVPLFATFRVPWNFVLVGLRRMGSRELLRGGSETRGFEGYVVGVLLALYDDKFSLLCLFQHGDLIENFLVIWLRWVKSRVKQIVL